MQTSPEIISDDVNSQCTVVRLNKDNLKELAKLYAEVYNARQPADYFFKKYNTAYTGVEYVGFIAYSNNQLAVAYYGVIPCFIEWGNKIILAGQAADLMTHPQYRYKGIFADLSRKTYDLCRQLGIRLIFGFPNQDSYKALINKPGWGTLETMDCFTIPVTGITLVSIFHKINFLKKIYRRYHFSVFKKKLHYLNGVANSALPDGFAGICRSEEYLYYKNYNASRVIRVGDSKVWISNRYGLAIGDIEGITETNFKTVINKLEKIARRSGVTLIQFHSSPGTSLHQLFSANYKPKPSFPIMFQDLGSEIPPEKIKFTFADIDIF